MKSGGVDGDFVGAGQQQGHIVGAGAAGFDAFGDVGFKLLDADLCRGDHGARGVLQCASDTAIEGLGREGEGDEEAELKGNWEGVQEWNCVQTGKLRGVAVRKHGRGLSGAGVADFGCWHRRNS